jgi:hypothetical protein
MIKNIVAIILIWLTSITVLANKREKLISILSIKQNPKIIENKKISGIICSNGEYYPVNQFIGSFSNNCICGNFYISHWVIVEEDSILTF